MFQTKTLGSAVSGRLSQDGAYARFFRALSALARVGRFECCNDCLMKNERSSQHIYCRTREDGKGLRCSTKVRSYLVEYVFQLVLCQSAALNVLHRSKRPGHGFTVGLGDGGHLLFCELFLDLIIVSQVHLGSHNQTRHTRAVVVDLGEPLLLYVLERGWRSHGEADEENIGLGIRKRSETVVIFLSCRIEESQGIRLIADPFGFSDQPTEDITKQYTKMVTTKPRSKGNRRSRNIHHRYCIIVEYRRNIFRGEFIGGIADEEAGLADRTVSDNDTPIEG